MFKLPLVGAVLFFTACGATADGDELGPDGSGLPTTPDAATLPTDDAGGGEEVTFSCGEGPSLDGIWQHSNVSNTSSAMGFHGRQAQLDNNQRQAVWAEVVAGNSDMEIYTGSLSNEVWTGSPLTNNPGVQNTFPALVSDGARMHLVWNGRQDIDDDNDIYMATYDGASWGTPADLTSSAEERRVRLDYRPSIAIGPDGSLLIAYLSRAYDASGNILPEDIFVIRVGSDGSASIPQLVLAGGSDPCSELATAIDVHGTGHILAACGPGVANHLVYSSDLSGSWESAGVSLAGGTTKEIIPRMVADGTDLHVAFRGDIPCAAGSCGEIFYAKRSAAGFAPAINISNSVDVRDNAPMLAVDSLHRPVVGYSVPGASDSDVHLSWCTGDAQFSTPINITAGSDQFRDEPTDIQFRPASFVPIVTYNRNFIGSSPLNVDIFSAELVDNVEN